MNTQVVTSDKTIFSPLNIFNTSGASTSKIEDDANNSDVEGKVKTRLLSMWNNVKFGMCYILFKIFCSNIHIF